MACFWLGIKAQRHHQFKFRGTLTLYPDIKGDVAALGVTIAPILSGIQVN
jgi:hypothetical protein